MIMGPNGHDRDGRIAEMVLSRLTARSSCARRSTISLSYARGKTPRFVVVVGDLRVRRDGGSQLLSYRGSDCMDRRDFIRLAKAIGVASWLGDLAFLHAAEPVRTRRTVTSQASAMDVQTLRTGVKKLKANKVITDYP